MRLQVGQTWVSLLCKAVGFRVRFVKHFRSLILCARSFQGIGCASILCPNPSVILKLMLRGRPCLKGIRDSVLRCLESTLNVWSFGRVSTEHLSILSGCPTWRGHRLIEFLRIPIIFGIHGWPTRLGMRRFFANCFWRLRTIEKDTSPYSRWRLTAYSFRMMEGQTGFRSIRTCCGGSRMRLLRGGQHILAVYDVAWSRELFAALPAHDS